MDSTILESQVIQGSLSSLPLLWLGQSAWLENTASAVAAELVQFLPFLYV